MKVILKSKIKNLGNIGDIVDVKDGYAKNMLLVNNLAVFYTEKNYEVFKIKKVEIENENAENKLKAEALKEKIIGKDLILIENAGDDGKLYGSVSGVKLANFINATLKVTDVKKSNIFLREPIKSVGKYLVIVELHPEVSFDKEIIIARSKEEAAKIKKGEFVIKKESTETVTSDLTTELAGKVEETEEEKAKKEKRKAKKEKQERKNAETAE
ncbi:MAG: 50S ribosomal protein L9 [Rickettsiales bacterium]|nr:50S ribosomal protein L9 [Rickettsiales bacterium]